jgi:Ca2+-transporting ATPase
MSDWHKLSDLQILTHFNSSKHFGLSSPTVLGLQSKHGLNELPQFKMKSFISVFFRQFSSPLIYLLIIASLLAFLVGDFQDAYIIILVLILNSLIGSFHELRAEHSLNSIRKLTQLKAKVLRDGLVQEIEARLLVPGDIFYLAAGDSVPTDGRILECSHLSTGEASLTGESLPVEKISNVIDQNVLLTDCKNMVFAGSTVLTGRGIAMAVSTGSSNEIGKIAQMTATAVNPKTQLEKKIISFGRLVTIIGLLIFILVLSLGLFQGIEFRTIFMIAVSQLVSLVPEGLPVALTIAFAIGVQRMAKKRTIVRRISAVESLGSTSVICTDKTGTLTKNVMSVLSIYLTNTYKWLKVTGIGHNSSGAILDENEKVVNVSNNSSYGDFQSFLEAGVLCNDSFLKPSTNGASSWEVLGDPTEGALHVLAEKAGLNRLHLHSHHPRTSEIPFDSNIKLMATEHLFNNRYRIYIKGAPESLFSLASNSLSEINHLKEAVEKMTKDALRVLALGVVYEGRISPTFGIESLKGKVRVLGLAGLTDPPRVEVFSSLQECKRAGIRTVMITGDHKSTAHAIAKSLGISTDTSMIIEGHELENLSDDHFHKLIDDVTVFARVHPAQKLRIVKAFQSKGHIVAMTGDGVNDAPALVQADIGVSMGISGTDVAKEASDIVITDDNFSTIVSAISEGRLVYQNIKKLILFLFVTSIDEVVILLLALLAGFPPPLAAVQILWINLVSESARENEKGTPHRRP